MPKKKNQLFSITKRDLIILVVLLLIAESYLLFTYVVMPKLDERQSSLDLQSMKTMQMNLAKTEFDKMDQIKTDIKSLKVDVIEKEKTLPPYLEEEEMILLLKGYADKSILDVSNTSYAEKKMDIYKPDEITNADGTTTTDANPNAAATAASPDASAPAATAQAPEATDPNVVKDEPTVIRQQIGITMQGSYSGFYDYLKSLQTNMRKLLLGDLSLTVAEDGTVQSTLQLENIAFKDSVSQTVYTLDVPVDTDKPSIFTPYPGYTSGIIPAGVNAGNVQAPDVYAIINSYLDNADKIMFGVYTVNESKLFQNVNSLVAGNLTLSQQGMDITGSIRLGDQSSKATFQPVLKDGKIIVRIISTARSSVDDKVGLKLDVNNGTQYPIVIEVVNDDAAQPRFLLGTTSGSVEVVKQ